ncbi:hypothetical protein JL722_7168 [Aureococcus anophagefferens]|nr:hypothetical protein JL722_7168 [Aureococcus anophagefferens]
MGSAASAPGAPSERLSIDEARALLPDGRAWRDSWDLRFTSVGIAEPKTVFDAVDDWLRSSDGSRLFWLMGGGGTGKSVSAELLRRLARGDAGLAWHFCRHDDAAQSSAGALIRSLSAMLGAAVGDAAKFREARRRRRASGDAAALFDALVAAPLGAALGGAGAPRRVVIVVDALDELS